jgi:hypothetical protein
MLFETSDAQAVIPVSQDEIPVSQDAIPVSQDEIPVSQDEIPGSQDEIPVSKDEIPISQDETPGSQKETSRYSRKESDFPDETKYPKFPSPSEASGTPNKTYGQQSKICSTNSRAAYVTEQCQRNGFNKEEFDRFGRIKKSVYVDDVYKLIYCRVPKAGSNTFLYYLWRLHVQNSEDEDVWAPNTTTFLSRTGIRNLQKPNKEEY